MNFASSFITFIEEFLIEDDNMKLILTGIRLLSNIFSLDFFRIRDEECIDG